MNGEVCRALPLSYFPVNAGEGRIRTGNHARWRRSIPDLTTWKMEPAAGGAKRNGTPQAWAEGPSAASQLHWPVPVYRTGPSLPTSGGHSRRAG